MVSRLEPGQKCRLAVPEGAPLVCLGCSKDLRAINIVPEVIMFIVVPRKGGAFVCSSCGVMWPEEIFTQVRLLEDGEGFPRIFGVPTGWLVPID